MKLAGDSSTMSSVVRATSPIRCKCGLECPIWTSSKTNSKGRSFFGCPLYKNKDKYCGFFKWCDEDLCVNSTKSCEMNPLSENVWSMKVALLEAKLGEIEAVKKMEVGALAFEMKLKQKEIDDLKFHLKMFKIFLLVIVFAFVINLIL